MEGQASENSNNINEKLIAITFKLKLISRALPFLTVFLLLKSLTQKKLH